MTKMAETLRSRAGADSHARERLASMAFDHCLPAVLSLTRDNRLYEKDDVKQQTWIFVLEAIDADKGIGDVLYYIKWYVINRLRDWIGATVRRYAYMVCGCCGHTMRIKPSKHRQCSQCDAGADQIESKSFVDHTVELDTTPRGYTDDYTSLYVEEFLGTLKDDRDREILLGYVAEVDRVRLAVRHNISAGRVSQIVNRLQSEYSNYTAAA
jgi:DNA-directed RNA polymerase specialized sigma24 family protein